MKKLYCIYDKVAQVYNAPFVAENEEVAKRSFLTALENSPFANDMALYHLGDFNDDTDGKIVSNLQCPVFIMNYVVRGD